MLNSSQPISRWNDDIRNVIDNDIPVCSRSLGLCSSDVVRILFSFPKVLNLVSILSNRSNFNNNIVGVNVVFNVVIVLAIEVSSIYNQ
jgi:hypothetical protein